MSSRFFLLKIFIFYFITSTRYMNRLSLLPKQSIRTNRNGGPRVITGGWRWNKKLFTCIDLLYNIYIIEKIKTKYYEFYWNNNFKSFCINVLISCHNVYISIYWYIRKEGCNFWEECVICCIVLRILHSGMFIPYNNDRGNVSINLLNHWDVDWSQSSKQMGINQTIIETNKGIPTSRYFIEVFFIFYIFTTK